MSARYLHKYFAYVYTYKIMYVCVDAKESYLYVCTYVPSRLVAWPVLPFFPTYRDLSFLASAETVSSFR